MLLRLWLAALVLAGCENSAEISPGLISSSPTATALPGSQRPDATPGEASAAPMPAGFPVHASMRAVEPEPQQIASWTASASGAELYAFYLRELVEAGFVIGLRSPGGEAAVIRFTGSDGVTYQLDLLGRAPVEVRLGPPHP